MTSKIEWAGQLKAAGIALPDNWGKLSTSRAETWFKTAMAANNAPGEPAPKKRTGIMGALAGAAMAVAGMASAVAGTTAAMTGLNDALAVPAKTPQTKAATMPKDPKWRRAGSGGGRGWYPARCRAVLPVPLTRQIMRRITLDAGVPAKFFRRFMEGRA